MRKTFQALRSHCARRDEGADRMICALEDLEPRVHLSTYLTMNSLGGSTAQALAPAPGQDIHTLDPDTRYDPVLSPNRDVEMSVAINPSNPLQLAGITITTGNDFQEVDVYHSEDGGNTWGMTAIRGAVDGYLIGGIYEYQRTDPSLAYDGSGILWISYIIKSPSAMLAVGRSLDNGASFLKGPDGQKFVTLASGNIDKSLLTTGYEPTTAGQAVYVAWSDYDTGLIMVAGSKDGGLNWTNRSVSSSPTWGGLYASPAVGPNGELYVAWDKAGLVLLGADLDGLWGTQYDFYAQPNVVHYSLAPIELGGPTPVLDVDRSGGSNNGTLYVVFKDVSSDGSTSVWMTHSHMQGIQGSWTWPAQRVDGIANTDEILPWLDVDQRSGAVSAIYYTVEADGLHARVATSTDGGATFASAEISAPVAGQNYSRFEYIGVAAQDGTAHALWSTASPTQGRIYDLYYSRISFASTNDDNVLTVTGTTAVDSILLRPSAVNADYLEVVVNGVLEYAGLFATLNQITVDGGAGNDSITIAAGVNVPVTVIGSGGDDTLATSGSQVTLNANSGSVTLNDSAIFAAVTIADGARVNLAADGSRFIRTNALTLASTATLDLFDNDLIVQSTSGGRVDVLADITARIASARGSGGSWLGNGITSTAAKNQPSHITGLAPVINEKLNGGQPAGVITATFDGQTVDENCILVKYSYNGDADINGLINHDDYFQINTGFLSNGALGGHRWGDFNFSGIINFDDYYLINTAFLGQGNTILGPSRGGGSGELGSGTGGAMEGANLSALTDFSPGLTIDLVDQATGGKTVQVTQVGQIVYLDVYATVTGTNANVRQAFQSIVGSFIATNVAGGAADGELYTDSMSSTFSSNGFDMGAQQDLNGDGNLDLGSSNLDDATGWWIATAASMRYASHNGTTWTWYLGTIAFQVDELLSGGGTTEINFLGRDGRDNGALWKVDGVLSDGSSPDMYVGEPVVLTR